MNIKLTRVKCAPGYTIGCFQVKDLDFWCLEDTVREVPGVPVAEWKEPGCTAIPAGKYQVILDYSNRFKKIMPHILDVPGFTGVRIHAGNTPEDTEGCLLLGKGLSTDGSRIMDSRSAVSEFMHVMEEAYDKGEEVWIEIT